MKTLFLYQLYDFSILSFHSLSHPFLKSKFIEKTAIPTALTTYNPNAWDGLKFLTSLINLPLQQSQNTGLQRFQQRRGDYR